MRALSKWEGISRAKLDDLSDCRMATQTFPRASKWSQHGAESRWSVPVETINHIRENSSEELSLRGFNFKRCHKKSHKLLLLTICTICPW